MTGVKGQNGQDLVKADRKAIGTQMTTKFRTAASLASVHFTADMLSSAACLLVAASHLQETHFDPCLSGRCPSAHRHPPRRTSPRLFEGSRDVISECQPESFPLIICCQAGIGVRGA